MKLYTYSTARQRLATVLEDASRDGQVQIRRQDGRVYAVMPVVTQAESPFANVLGRSVNSMTSEELLRTLREDGWKRGARMIRRARAARLGRTKGRTR
jgi:antitoxin Phd